jgi:tetratricopeptide (TPR) repeat protein
LPVVGQYERAVEESTEGIRLRPDDAIAYGFGIRAYTVVNRYDEAKATYAQALERKLHTPFLDRVMYELAFAENDTAGMAQHAAKLEALPRFGHQMLSMEGDTAAYSGHLKDAREFKRRAMDNAQRSGEKDAPGLYSGTSGLREAWFGNTGEARRRATLALKLSTGRDLQYFAALAFAYASDNERAKALADDLDKRFPEDTIVQFNYLPSVRGKLALNKGDASGAIQSLEGAAPYELGATRAIDCVGPRCFQSSCVAKPIWLRIRVARLPPSSRRSSTIAASSSTNPSVRLPILASVALMCCRATPRKPVPPIRTSSHSGKTPTLTFPS